MFLASSHFFSGPAHAYSDPLLELSLSRQHGTQFQQHCEQTSTSNGHHPRLRCLRSDRYVGGIQLEFPFWHSLTWTWAVIKNWSSSA